MALGCGILMHIGELVQCVCVQCSKLAKMREKVGTERGEQPVCYCKILSCFELRLPLPSLQDHLPPLPCPPTHSQAPM